MNIRRINFGVVSKLEALSLTIPVYKPDGRKPKRAKHARGIELHKLIKSRRLYLTQGNISSHLNRDNSLILVESSNG